jgi:hypothetical protein
MTDRVSRIVAGLPSNGSEAEWEEPVPLPGTGAVPEWPVGLGDMTDEYIKAVAVATATPPDLAGITALGVAATLTAGKVRIEGHIGWAELSNLYLTCVVASGEGKTPAYAEVVRPLFAIEREQRAASADDLAAASSRKRLADALARRLEDLAAKTEDDKLRGKVEENAVAAAVDASRITVPAPVRLWTKEATPEGLLRLLAEHDGRMAVLTDEGADHFDLASRYSANGRANHGLYLAGYDGLPYASDRAGRDAVVLPRAVLTIMLMVQPAVLSVLAKDRLAHGRGLYARHLWSMPASQVGRRPTHREAVPDRLRVGWTEHLAGIAAAPGADLGLDVPAKRRFDTWRDSHEPRLGPAGDLASIVEAGNKMPGQVLHLAGNLHALRTGTLAGSVSDETMEATLTFADYFIGHALAVYAVMGCDDATEDGRGVLRWIAARHSSHVTTSEIAHSRDWPADRVRDALQTLERYGWVRAAKPSGGPGRPSERWETHPQLHRRSPA